MKPNKIKLSDVKAALMDARFRERLPAEVSPDIQKFLQNPGCACNAPLYRKILYLCSDQLREYFPGKEYESPLDEDARIAQNHWTVINCKADELEAQLRSLPPGRKQIAIARYEDEITVIVNELDLLYTP
jgi:hypothetical protein